jgi:S-adenosylmethionine:diacylglycerol 3-amino-3-carboxypropyl transferase
VKRTEFMGQMKFRIFSEPMGVLYYYGISQEDVLTEFKALEIARHDSLLCIASGGDLPLNMAALQDLTILAVDNSINQLRLCRIKQVAAILLDSIKAASFLGYMNISNQERQRIFRYDIRKLLSEEDCLFWEQHSGAIKQGVINSARFEQYIRKVSALGCSIIGRKNLYRLFDCGSVEEQKAIFDRWISNPLLKSLLKISFHPGIYRIIGINPVRQTHSGTRNIPEFFFQRFRNFCCSTLARKNYYFQYTFFKEVLFAEALPEYLQPAYHESFIKNIRQVEFMHASLENVLSKSEAGQFNKIHLSNISDWMPQENMDKLFNNIRDKTRPGARAIIRYIHLNHLIPESIPELVADYDLGEALAITDRYPFYSIVPIIRQ